jgi:hypothetical protein
MDFASRRSARSRPPDGHIHYRIIKIAIDLNHIAAVIDHVQHTRAPTRLPIADGTTPFKVTSRGLYDILSSA